MKNSTNRWILLSTIILFIFNTHTNGLDLDINSSKPGWNKFAKNINCKIESNIEYANPGLNKYPVFKILLKYNGRDRYTIKWDENFGSVLWEGKFVLISKVKNTKETTTELKFHTSNTYPPGKTVKLKAGYELSSTLDFTKLPGRYAKNLFSHKGKAGFRLCVVSGSKGKLKHVSNELIIVVK